MCPDLKEGPSAFLFHPFPAPDPTFRSFAPVCHKNPPKNKFLFFSNNFTFSLKFLLSPLEE